VVFDLDGCLYVGDQPVAGARKTLERLRRRGFRLLFATNNSTKTAEVVANRLGAITGFTPAPEAVITSADAATTMLRDGDEPVMPIGEAGLVGTLVANGVSVTEEPSEARTVMVGLDRAISYDRIRRAAQAVILGARFIGTNPDATFPTDSVPVPGAGAIIAAVERAGGRPPEFAGKPFEPMRHAIERRLGGGPTWMVGDRPDTDIACGRLAGWTTVLVLTGVAADANGLSPESTPDHVIPSVAALRQVIGW
jgi:4-nitrophenyl phosphatase